MRSCFIFMMISVIMPSVAWAQCGQVTAAAGTPYLSIYADTTHSIRSVDGTPLYMGEVWVWGLPDSRGMAAAEFALSYPSNVYPQDVVWNPDVTVHLGTPAAGVSAAFGTCRNDWTWIMRQPFWVSNSDRSQIELVADPMEGRLVVASCEPGYPVYEARSLATLLYVNCNGERESMKPRLSSVTTIAADTVIATFSNRLSYDACLWGSAQNLRVISRTSPPETIQAVYAWMWGESDKTIFVKLGRHLFPNTSYVLQATDICNFFLGCECQCLCSCMNCADSEMDFSYEGVATLLHDFSVEPFAGGIRVSWELGVADEGMAFVPMRLERGSAAFEPLTVSVAEEGSLRYRLVDPDVRPGSALKYRVDYTVNGKRSTLFETDWVEALPVSFALHQNLPNPFNPSTRISFDLAEPCHATLAVYDVSGKLVRTLVDEDLAAGAHAADWDGRTGRGQMVSSGIYFYKLRAGSFTETRKMVLLK